MSDATMKKTKYQVLVAYQKTEKGYYNQPMLSSKATKKQQLYMPLAQTLKWLNPPSNSCYLHSPSTSTTAGSHQEPTCPENQ